MVTPSISAEEAEIRLSQTLAQLSAIQKELDRLNEAKEDYIDIITKMRTRGETEERQAPVYEMFMDRCYFDMWCVRDSSDRSFESPRSFHFDQYEDANTFLSLIRRAR